MALIGQKRLSGKANKLIVSDFPPKVFGFFTLTDNFVFDLKPMSAQEQVEDGS